MLTLGQRTGENRITVNVNAAGGRGMGKHAIVVVVQGRGRGWRGFEEEAQRAALTLWAGGRGEWRGWR